MKNLFDKLSPFKVIIFCGLPGSGKTSIAKKIKLKINANYLSTDQIRTKELFTETSRFDRANSSQEEHVKVVRRATYEELAKRALVLASKGERVILDGSFLDEMRDLVIEKLRHSVDRIAIVVVKTKKEVIRSRISKEERKIWEREVYNYFKQALKEGRASYPISDKFVTVFKVRND